MIFFFPPQGNLIHRKEEHIRVKFQAWWHFIGLLGPKIRQQVDSIIIPFLNFCFTASYGSSSPDSSPAKKYDSLRPLFLEATAILICGKSWIIIAIVNCNIIEMIATLLLYYCIIAIYNNCNNCTLCNNYTNKPNFFQVWTLSK